MDLEFEDEIISRIAITKDEKFVDTHDVPPSAPISLCDQFRCMHVCIYLKGSSEERNWPSRTASSVLMAASRERVLPSFISPTSGKTLRSDQKLHNDLIGMQCFECLSRL